MTPLSKEVIEEYGSKFHAMIHQTFPHLTTAEIAALMGYTSSFILNSAIKSPLFLQYGKVCYDILATPLDTEPITPTNEDRPVGAQDAPDSPDRGEGSSSNT